MDFLSRRVTRWTATAITLALFAIACAALLYARTTHGLDRCMEIRAEGKAHFTCAEEVVAKRLRDETAEQLMSSLASIYEKHTCHYLGHFVGQELYRRTDSVSAAFAECSHACASACFHGVVGAAFVEGVGMEEETAFAHPGIEDIRDVGSRLCSERQSCHALGHILFPTIGDLRQALALCDEVAVSHPPFPCYRGAFMESSHPMITYDIAGAEKVRKVEPPDLLYPCMEVPVKYRHACLRSLHLMQHEYFVHHGIADGRERTLMRLEVCETFLGELREACIEGIGESLQEHPALILTTCGSLAADDRPHCYFGASQARTDFGFLTESLAVCARLNRMDDKRGCYQGAFDAIRGHGIELHEDACARTSDVMCAETLRSFTANPEDLVFIRR